MTLEQTDQIMRLGAGFNNLVRAMRFLLVDKYVYTNHIRGIIKSISCNPYKDKNGKIFVTMYNGVEYEFSPFEFMQEFKLNK